MDRLRRTMLYVPGSKPGMIKDIYIYQPDAIMFDLEDSVSITEKDSARFLVSEALKQVDYQGIETVVRINGLDTEFGLEDLKLIVQSKPDVIRLPKTEKAEDVWKVEKIIDKLEKEYGIEKGSINMMAAIESAMGVLNAAEIAKSSKRLIGIALGAEDYVTNIKTKRSPEGTELLFARSQILNAARAYNIAAIDTVYSDVDNIKGFRREVEHIKQLGFDGKSIINPKQIEVVHDVYNPKVEEIEEAIEIWDTMKKAKEKGQGVISLRGKMIDKPIIDRAKRILDLAGVSYVEW